MVFKNSHIRKDKIRRSNYIDINTKNNKIYQEFFKQDEFLKSLIKNFQNKDNLMQDNMIMNYEKNFIKIYKRQD